jgi:hypothetical protein
MNAKDYDSPTTPGLRVTFQAYVVELVCLNMDRRLGAYFWRKEPWKSKFGRECIGFNKLVRLHEGVDNSLLNRAVVYAIKTTQVKTMLSPAALKRIDKSLKSELQRITTERETLRATVAPEITDVAAYMKANTGVYVISGNSLVTRLKAVEDNGQGNDSDLR